MNSRAASAWSCGTPTPHITPRLHCLRSGVPQVGGEPVQPGCLGVVLRDPRAILVHQREVELRSGLPLVGGEPVQPGRLGVVLLDPGTVLVHHRGCTALWPPPGRRRAGTTGPFGVVLRDLRAIRVHHPEVALRSGVPLVDGEPEQPDRLRVVLRNPRAIRVHQREVEQRCWCVLAGWSRDQAQDLGREVKRSAANQAVGDSAHSLCHVAVAAVQRAALWANLPWSASCSRQIGHGCAGSASPSPAAVAGTEGYGAMPTPAQLLPRPRRRFAVLPPRAAQCCFWHRRPQYHTALHPSHRWLTLSRPVTGQPTLAQGKEAFFFFPIFLAIQAVDPHAAFLVSLRG